MKVKFYIISTTDRKKKDKMKYPRYKEFYVGARSLFEAMSLCSRVVSKRFYIRGISEMNMDLSGLSPEAMKLLKVVKPVNAEECEQWFLRASVT